MTEIHEETIKNKGLEYIRSLDTFLIWGNHYFAYPEVLKELKDEFECKTEYFGPSDQGSAKTIFTKKESDVIIRERLQSKINQFAESNNIIIKDWEYNTTIKKASA